MGFFFWKRDETKPNNLIYSPQNPNSEASDSSTGASSASGLLATPNSEYPLSFSYDFSPFTFDPSEPSSNQAPESPWSDIDGINDWVDLGNIPSNQ